MKWLRRNIWWICLILGVLCLYNAVIDYGQHRYYWALYNFLIGLTNLWLARFNWKQKQKYYDMHSLHFAALQGRFEHDIRLAGGKLATEAEQGTNLFFCLTSMRYCPDCGTYFDDKLVEARPKQLSCTHTGCGSGFELNYRKHTATRVCA